MSWFSRSAPASRKPRLLHVTTVPQTLLFLPGHIAYAQRHGLEVHAASSGGDVLDLLGQQLRMPVHAVPMSRRITPLRDLRSLWRLVRVMRRVRPLIVDGHTPKGGLLAMLAGAFCRVPVRVYHLHGLPLVTARSLKRRLLRATERLACRLAHQVLCVSRSVADLAVAEGLCPAAKIKTLEHGCVDGVDADGRYNPARVSEKGAMHLRRSFGIPSGAFIIGFAGRIVRDKGVVELVQAWQALRAEFADLHLLIAGEFESEDPIPLDAEAALRTDPRIHLTGYLTDPSGFYRVLDLFVLPTYREGFGLALLEASAMEAPVVATRIPGCVDAVRDGQTGTLVTARDASALADAIRAYVRDADLRRRHGRQGRERVLRDFRPEALRSALQQEYARLVHARGLALAPVDEPSSDGDQQANELPVTFYRLVGKRVFDVLASVTALLVLAPVLLVLAALVRICLGSPFLFRQVRTGLHKRRFTILKFRTMTDERDQSGELLPDTSRLTRLGRFLRATSLDELPELINILKGDMSFVGPRPLLPRYDTFYSARENLRFEMLPGLSGWAQINGRNDLAWDDRLACDVAYAESCAFLVDLKILLLTVGKVLRRDNVAVDPSLTFGALDDERKERNAALARSGEASFS